MSNIWNVWDKQVIKIESTFNVTSKNHNFLSKVLENYGFSQEFLKWISIFLQSQESFVINRNKIFHFPLKEVHEKAILFWPAFLFLSKNFIFIKVKMFKTWQLLTICYYAMHTRMTQNFCSRGIFLQSQELFFINRNKMCHFPLKRGTWQDNPNLTCLFVLI